MNALKITLIVAVAILSTGVVFAEEAKTETSKWLATGTVTKIDGSTFYFLGKDNKVYEIDAEDAEVLFERFCANCYSIRAGDVVKVYGDQVNPDKVEAIRVRIVDPVDPGKVTESPEGDYESRVGEQPEKEVKVIIEEDDIPARGEIDLERPEGSWEARGLITGIEYTGERVTVQTPQGPYTINVNDALILNNKKVISLAQLTEGDAVIVNGEITGLKEIDATHLKVTRKQSAAQAALPQLPVSAAGTILEIDYPSFTFKMGTESGSIVVAADTNTVIQQYQDVHLAFMDLKPGMRVKMSGYGSLGTGFVAQHITVISVAP